MELRWVFTSLTHGTSPKPCLKLMNQDLKAILSWTSCGLSSKVGLIVSIFPKVCSILWAPWSMDFFHKWSSCWSLRVKIEDDPLHWLGCEAWDATRKLWWCQDGYSSDFPLCEPKSRCKTFLSLSYRCHSIQGLKPDPFSYRWRFFSSPETANHLIDLQVLSLKVKKAQWAWNSHSFA